MSELIFKLDDDLKEWYEKYKIYYERNELYYSFFLKLFSRIEETYLGDDVLDKQEIAKEHFKWCYNKTIDDFKSDDFIIINDGPLFDYLWFFFYNSFYKMPNNDNVKNIHIFFKSLFNYAKNKSNIEKDTYKFLYKLFEITFIF